MYTNTKYEKPKPIESSVLVFFCSCSILKKRKCMHTLSTLVCNGVIKFKRFTYLRRRHYYSAETFASDSCVAPVILCMFHLLCATKYNATITTEYAIGAYLLYRQIHMQISPVFSKPFSVVAVNN